MFYGGVHGDSCMSVILLAVARDIVLYFITDLYGSFCL